MPTKIEKDSLSGQNTTGHEWDGLKELNTPLPRWWLWTFYACIAFSLVWVVIYPALPIPGATGTSGWIAREAVMRDVQQAEARMAPMMSRLRAATPEQIAADPELRAFAMAGGRGAFANNCAGCHGAGGQGAILVLGVQGAREVVVAPEHECRVARAHERRRVRRLLPGQKRPTAGRQRPRGAARAGLAHADNGHLALKDDGG
jgi:hypothetical protein